MFSILRNSQLDYDVCRCWYTRIVISLLGMLPHPLLQRVGFLRRFGQKTGIDFAQFGLESGMVFELR